VRRSLLDLVVGQRIVRDRDEIGRCHGPPVSAASVPRSTLAAAA
jgi:hypothetical protein